jgi:hypothetical protein
VISSKKHGRNAAPASTFKPVRSAGQDADCTAISGYGSDAVVGFARFWPDQHAKGRWLANAR